MNLHIGKMLGGIAGTLHLYDFFSKIGVEAFFYRKCYQDKLQASTLFFENNKERINLNIELFEDIESKTIYEKAIRYRCTHLLRDRPPYCKEKEYFNSITPIGQDEILIDCGGFSGDSVLQFVDFSSNCYSKIVSFEPDSVNYQIELKNLANVEKCKIFNLGVWEKETQLFFEEINTAGSKVDLNNKNGNIINVIEIDSFEECKNASFIKMDIEGSELQALCGARNTIKNNRPILTICIYHSDEDMLSIPEWMRNNLDNYCFYCRHHSYYQQETILYAIPKERRKIE